MSIKDYAKGDGSPVTLSLIRFCSVENLVDRIVEKGDKETIEKLYAILTETEIQLQSIAINLETETLF